RRDPGTEKGGRKSGRIVRLRRAARARLQALRRKQAFRTSPLILSELPSMCSASSSTRRMPRIMVPCFSGIEDPLTFRSLITTTLSPSARTLPLQSRTCGPVPPACATIGHSKPQSAQTKLSPSGYVFSPAHCGQAGISVIGCQSRNRRPVIIDARVPAAARSLAPQPRLVRIDAGIALAPGHQFRLVEGELFCVDVEHAAVAAAFAAVEGERFFRRARR